MKKIRFIAIIVGVTIGFLVTASAVHAETVFSPPPAVAVCFTPGEDCDKALIAEINSAQSTVRMAAYSMTSESIADALIAARQRGVKVWVVLDKGQWKARKAQGHRMREHGVGVRYDGEHQLMHNKFVVIDIQQTATGSYNFTKSAQKRNAENMLFIDDKDTAQEYADNWGWHWSHAVREPE